MLVSSFLLNGFNLNFLLLSLLSPIPALVQKAETVPGSQTKEDIGGVTLLLFCPPTHNP